MQNVNCKLQTRLPDGQVDLKLRIKNYLTAKS